MARTLPRTAIGVLAAASLIAWTALARAETTITVVSYNVFAIPWVSPARHERVAEIATRLAALNPDVVALQELWEPEDAAVIGAALKRIGLVHQSTGATPGGSGLMLASRFDVVAKKMITYAAGRTWWVPWHLDFLADKGLVAFTLDTPAGPMVVANTHMQSTYRTGDYAFVQNAQVLRLSAALDEFAAPLILVGDLNATPTSLPVRLLTTKSRLSPARDDFRIDHVLHRSASTVKVTVESVTKHFTEPVELPSGDVHPLSDHPCLMATFVLDPCSDCAPTDGRWADVSQDMHTFASDELATAKRTRWLCLVAVLAPLFAAWLLAGGAPWRWRRRRTLRWSGVLVAAVLASWLLYLAFVFQPYEIYWLERLSQVTAPTTSPAHR
jgi:endonuclease/exonuclease/phosphatase family metal-dependent hydrolase